MTTMGQCLFDCGEGENKTLEMIYFALSVKQITTVRGGKKWHHAGFINGSLRLPPSPAPAQFRVPVHTSLSYFILQFVF